MVVCVLVSRQSELCLSRPAEFWSDHGKKNHTRNRCLCCLMTEEKQFLLCFHMLFLFIKCFYLFIWLHQVIVAACGIFSLGHVGSSTLTRDWASAPRTGSTESQPPDHQRSPWIWAFECGTSGKGPPANVEDVRDVGSILGSGRFLGGV